MTDTADAGTAAAARGRIVQPEDAAQPTVEELQAQLEQERQWRVAAIQGAHKFAQDRNFCREFDTIISDLGFPERKQARTGHIGLNSYIKVEIPEGTKDQWSLTGAYRDAVYDQIAQLIAGRKRTENPLGLVVSNVTTGYVDLTEAEILAAAAVLATEKAKPKKPAARRRAR